MSSIAEIKRVMASDPVAARNLLDALLAREPASVEARILLGEMHLRSLEFRPALALFDDLAEDDAVPRQVLDYIGGCHMALGDYEAALAAYRRAFAATSTAYPLSMACLALHRLGRLGEGIQTYDRLLQACPPEELETSHALHGIVAALRDAGECHIAERYTDRLVERFRHRPLTVASSLAERNNTFDFPGWSPYADKAFLGIALQRYAEITPGRRFPSTFVLPEQRAALASYAARETSAVFIAKPKRGSGGQGIFVTADAASVAGRDDIVVQRYIANPYLVDGRKGHLRIYGLITTVQPLRAYVYTEGIVRFAPQRYDPRPEHLADVAMHITNTALHHGNPALVISADAGKDDVGNIWSLSALLRRMAAEGFDAKTVLDDIVALTAWFVGMLAADGLFARQAAAAPARSFPAKLFGLDVLLDANGAPWLIEMQRKPAAAGSPLVEKISGELFSTIFRMTTGPLVADGTAPERQAAILADPAAREREIESEQRGLFIPLTG